jgi:hypothetical protein
MSSSDTDEGCTICIQEYEDRDVLRYLPCGHIYHAMCVDKWLRLKGQCPACRQTIQISYEKRNWRGRCCLDYDWVRYGWCCWCCRVRGPVIEGGFSANNNYHTSRPMMQSTESTQQVSSEIVNVNTPNEPAEFIHTPDTGLSNFAVLPVV